MNDASFRFLIQQQFDEELSPQQSYALERYLETNQQGANFYSYLKQIADSAIEIELPAVYRPEDGEELSRYILEALPEAHDSIFNCIARALKRLLSPRRSAQRAEMVQRLVPGDRKEESSDQRDGTAYGERLHRDQIDTGGRRGMQDQIDTGGRRGIDCDSFDNLKKLAGEVKTTKIENCQQQSRTRSLGQSLGVIKEIENADGQQLTLAELIKQRVHNKMDCQNGQEGPNLASVWTDQPCNLVTYQQPALKEPNPDKSESEDHFAPEPDNWIDPHNSELQSHIIAENASSFSNSATPYFRHPWESPSERAHPQMAPSPDDDPPERQPIIRKVERKKAPPTQQFPRPNELGVWIEEPEADKNKGAGPAKEMEPKQEPVPLPIEAIIERISLLFAETVAEELEAVKASQSASASPPVEPATPPAAPDAPRAQPTRSPTKPGIPVFPAQFLAHGQPGQAPSQAPAPANPPAPAEAATPGPPPVLPIDGLLERISLLFYDPADPTANLPAPSLPPVVEGRPEGAEAAPKRNTAEPWAPWLQAQAMKPVPPPLPKPVPPPLPPIQNGRAADGQPHFTSQAPFPQNAPQDTAHGEPVTEQDGTIEKPDNQSAETAHEPLVDVRRPLVKMPNIARDEAANSMGRIHGPSVSSSEDELQGRIAHIGRFLLDDRTIEQLGTAVVTGLSPSKMRVLTIEAARELEACLRPVDDQDGVSGCIIMGYDGLLVASTLPTNFDIESLATLSLASYMTTLQAARAAGHSRVMQLALRTEAGHLVLSDFGRGVLIVVTDNPKPESLPKLMWTIKHISAH